MVDATFAWHDSYTHERKEYKNPLAERLCVLYNLAAMHNHLVCPRVI